MHSRHHRERPRVIGHDETVDTKYRQHQHQHLVLMQLPAGDERGRQGVGGMDRDGCSRSLTRVTKFL